MLIQRILIILVISAFSFGIFFNIMLRTSHKVIIDYYKEVLNSLSYGFDIDSYKQFLIYPKKNTDPYKKLFNYLNTYSNNLGLDNIYISTIDKSSNNEIILIDGKNSSPEIGKAITPGIGHKAFEKKQVMYDRIDYMGETLYSYYSPILDNNSKPIGLLSFNVREGNLFKLNINRLFQIETVVFLSIIVFLAMYIYVTTLILWNILKPIYIIKSEVTTVSNKIFAINSNISFSSYEFNVIQTLFVKSISLINNFIMSLIIYLEYIKFSISKVKITSIEIINKIKLMTSHIVKISRSTDNVNQESDNLRDNMSTFSDEILEIKKDLKKILDLNTSGINLCHNNNAKLNEFLMEISILIKKFKLEQSECMKLKILSDKINKILENILTITNETKLLSLNASIVAISAGEHGKSFGVIAKEVGELSQNIIKSTSYIQQTLIKISAIINYLNQESIEIFNLFKSHSEKSEIFASKLTEIYNSIINTSNFIKDVSYSTDKINAKNVVILENVTILTINSSSNLNSIKQVENLINQINDNALTFRKNFEDLNDNINQIKFDLNKFRL